MNHSVLYTRSADSRPEYTHDAKLVSNCKDVRIAGNVCRDIIMFKFEFCYY